MCEHQLPALAIAAARFPQGTGRAGSKGVAMTFLLAADARFAPGLCEILKEEDKAGTQAERSATSAWSPPREW